jgi:mRNA-degrading endonuclease RelE of RelBE toxin-antitoxin system
MRIKLLPSGNDDIVLRILTKASGIAAASIFRVKYGSYRIILIVDKYL